MTTDFNAEELVQADLQHFWHPSTPIAEHMRTGPLILVEGEGIMLKDIEGREYIDAFGGLWNVAVGYGREELVEAASEQMRRVAYVPNYFGTANVPAIQLASKLAELTPPSLNRFFFTNGGSEANETAFKIVRRYFIMQGSPEKQKIISHEMGFHGVSLGALSATGTIPHRENFGALVPGFFHIPPPYCYRCPFGYTDRSPRDCCMESIGALENTIQREGADTVAAFIMEPVMGAGGAIVLPPEYLPRVAEVCRRNGMLLITDEVVTGFGRTGELFAVNHEGVEPDLMTMSKSIISGYLPFGAVGIREDIYQDQAVPGKSFSHGFTNSGHPVSCAVALRNLDIILEENLTANSAKVGAHLLDRLRELLELPWVGDVRGLGLLAAVELVADKETRAKFDPSANVGQQVAVAARDNGLLLRPIGDTIVMAPPLVITEGEVDALVDKLTASIEVLDISAGA